MPHTTITTEKMEYITALAPGEALNELTSSLKSEDFLSHKFDEYSVSYGGKWITDYFVSPTELGKGRLIDARGVAWTKAESIDLAARSALAQILYPGEIGCLVIDEFQEELASRCGKHQSPPSAPVEEDPQQKRKEEEQAAAFQRLEIFLKQDQHLLKLVGSLKAEHAALRKENAMLQASNKELQERADKPPEHHIYYTNLQEVEELSEQVDYFKAKSVQDGKDWRNLKRDHESLKKRFNTLEATNRRLHGSHQEAEWLREVLSNYELANRNLQQTALTLDQQYRQQQQATTAANLAFDFFRRQQENTPWGFTQRGIEDLIQQKDDLQRRVDWYDGVVKRNANEPWELALVRAQLNYQLGVSQQQHQELQATNNGLSNELETAREEIQALQKSSNGFIGALSRGDWKLAALTMERDALQQMCDRLKEHNKEANSQENEDNFDKSGSEEDNSQEADSEEDEIEAGNIEYGDGDVGALSMTQSEMVSSQQSDSVGSSSPMVDTPSASDTSVAGGRMPFG